MIKTYCDLCRKAINDDEKSCDIEISRMIDEEHADYDRYDICEQCYKIKLEPLFNEQEKANWDHPTKCTPTM